MATELEDRLKELAAGWDAAAPPVTADEARGRMGRPAGDVPMASGAAKVRQRRWPILAGVIAVAAATIVLVAVVRDDPRPSISPSNSELSEVASTTTPATSIEPTTAPSAVPSVDDQLADVSASVAAALSTFDSFRATVTLSRTQQQLGTENSQPVPTIDEDLVNVVTLSSDGTIWSEGEVFLWTSYDATTGVSRGAVVGQDGVTRYEESVGWADNSTPLLLLFGYYPVMHFDVLGDPTLTASTSHLGRAAWQITSTFAGGVSGSPDDVRTETFTIDQQTGLVVAYEMRQTLVGREDVTQARLDDLVVDATLPAEFPGTFPDGADVQRGGDPSGFTVLSVSDAAAAFGAGFVVPALADDASPRVTLIISEFPAEGGSPAGALYQVMVEWHNGFVMSSFSLSKSVITDGSPPPAGVLVVDGAVCPSSDGVHCDYFDAPSIVTHGAWSGSPSLFDGPRVSITNGPIRGTAAGPTAEAALAIANSLTTVEF